MALERVLSTPLTEDEANSLTDEEKDWLRSWNRDAEIPGEDGTVDDTFTSLFPNGVENAAGMGDGSGGDVGEYDDLTVPELKEKLADRELPVSGNKQELIDRLVADDESDDEEDDEDDA